MKGFHLAFTFAVVTAFAQPTTLLCQDDSTNAAPRAVYRIGGDVKAPRQLYAPMPEYSDKGRKERKQGFVVIKMIVGDDGLPRDIKVDHSLSPDLDQSAVNCVKKWKFSPANKEGEPVAVEMTVEVSFHLLK